MAPSKKGSWVYGFKPVLDALSDPEEQPLELWIASNRRQGVEKLTARAHDREVPVISVHERQIDKQARKGNHQGIALRCAAFAYADYDTTLRAILANKQAPQRPLILALDGIQDPRNLGAILRSACGLGVDLVLVPERRACPITPTVVRASAGQARKIPVAQVKNLVRTFQDLKDQGFWIAGTHPRKAIPPWKADLSGPLVLVLGSEGDGMRRLVAERCDFHLTIPLAAQVESLNVSAAAAMFLYECVRQTGT